MSCKSLVYLNNSNSQTLDANDEINFGNVVRRFGDNLNVSGGNVITIGTGYYDIDANITMTSASATTVTVQLYRDGVKISGAVGTVAIAANGVGSVSIPAVIREVCCCESTITAQVSGAVTVTNASIVVKKV